MTLTRTAHSYPSPTGNDPPPFKPDTPTVAYPNSLSVHPDENGAPMVFPRGAAVVRAGDGRSGPITAAFLAEAPTPEVVPAGWALAHNQHRPMGVRGGCDGTFSAWLQPTTAGLSPCACRWAPDVTQHYTAALNLGATATTEGDH